jgi:hypothetical protein
MSVVKSYRCLTTPHRDEAPATFQPTLFVYQDEYLNARESLSVGR